MKLLILGIGNILFGDEGIGVHLCNFLKVNYRFAPTPIMGGLRGSATKSGGLRGLGRKESNNIESTNHIESSNTESIKPPESTIDFIDGGTLANMLIPLIVEYDRVLILDCVSVEGASVGDVYSFGFDAIPECITWAGSAHEVEMLQTLSLARLMGDLPDVRIIGIIPEIIGEDTAFTLSESLLKGAITMEREALKFIESNGFKPKKIKDIPLQEIAQTSFRGVD